ncbi:acyltransferase family-domain-containing protein [Dactylonectria estremocensis]|uniref:Acyltransferase family-domain-containing protein n=1 Tax=Dactylonectria estremocensis TaxID=1079267 RepID=A0A9P9FB77_9HYPO|nr:acyltransferase family-domain-containing protein [Dactylonectria estremocensis]
MNGQTSRREASLEQSRGLLNRSSSPASASAHESGDMNRVTSQLGWFDHLRSPIEYTRSLDLPLIISRVLWFLVPSFLQGRQVRDQLFPAILGPTAYLDGVRGVASLMVFNMHYFSYAYDPRQSWGCSGENYEIIRLPILRVTYGGGAAVAMFFIISGYALSYRCLKLVRSRNIQGFSTSLSSLVFRRAMRLFIPTISSTFIILCFCRLNFYEWARENANNPAYFRGGFPPKRLGSFSEQLLDWAGIIFNSMQVFDWNKFTGLSRYDIHLWTIPVEFRCSLYLFLVLIGTAHLRTRARVLVLSFVIWFTYQAVRWDFLLFLFGMVLVEWDLYRGAHTLSSALPLTEKGKAKSKVLKAIFWNLIIILGLYLLSQPDYHPSSTPGWKYLTSMIPERWETFRGRFWQCAGALLFMLAIGHLEYWQRFFTLDIIQYLGKISYSLYIVHGTVILLISLRLDMMMLVMTGVEGIWYHVGFLLGSCFAIPIIIWCADIFWRAVDIPSVKLAKWFEGKLGFGLD